MVLEARDRIGGRLHSSRLWQDLPMDLGASWIHGVTDNPITDLAQAAGAKVVPTSYDAALLLDRTGDRIDPDLDRAEQLLRRALARAERLEDDISVQAALEGLPEWQRADATLRREVAYLVNSTLEHEYGGAATQLSAWYGDAGKAYSGAEVLFPMGYDAITTYLSKGLDIRLRSNVTKIAPGYVTLGDGTRIAADRIVCTLPLGVLRAGHITFSEPLAPARLAAIAGLRMGLLNKCFLRFDRIDWPDDVDWIGWLGPESGIWAEWVSMARALRAPVLLGFNAATQAAKIENLDDRATIAAAHDALRAMFSSGFPKPIAAQITRWGHDPFSLGSYSFNAVGTGPQTRRDLAGPDWDGALWFAGEATEPDYFGTAHGAYLSGLNVARAMLRH